MTRETHTTAPVWRCAGVALLVLAGSLAAVALIGPELRHGRAALADGTWAVAGLDQLIVWAACLCALLCLAWLNVVTLLVCSQAARAGAVTAEHGPGPRALRRLILLGCGAGLAVSISVPAHAGTVLGPVSNGAVGAVSAGTVGMLAAGNSLDGLALPDRVESGGHGRGGAVRSTPPEHRLDAPTVVVRDGDCLWRLAEQRLGPGATDAEIADLTSRMHARNRGVIGDDPDLIQPETVLRMPRS